MLEVNLVAKAYKTTFQCSYCLGLQPVSLDIGSVFKNLKQFPIIIGCWEIRWSGHLLFSAGAHFSGYFNIQLASMLKVKQSTARKGKESGDNVKHAHQVTSSKNHSKNQGLGSTRPHAECFPGSDDAPSWEMCNFSMGMGPCFYPMTHKKHQGSHVEIMHFRTPLSYMSCVLVMG